MILINKQVSIKIITLSMFLIFVINCIYAEIPEASSEFYANDTADLLSNETEEYIINNNKKLYEETGAQIVVVTVENLDGRDIESYATEMFRSYKIGNKEKNNGVLMLLALEERLFRIEVGYGLEGVLTDGKTGRIQDEYIIPYLKDNNFDEGVLSGFKSILNEVQEEYLVNIDNLEEYSVEDDLTTMQVISIGIIMIIDAIIIIGFIRKIPKNRNNKFAIYLAISGLICHFISFITYDMLVWLVIYKVLLMLPTSGLGGSNGRGGSSGGGFQRRFFWRKLFWWRFFRWWRLIWPEEEVLEDFKFINNYNV